MIMCKHLLNQLIFEFLLCMRLGLVAAIATYRTIG